MSSLDFQQSVLTLSRLVKCPRCTRIPLPSKLLGTNARNKHAFGPRSLFPSSSTPSSTFTYDFSAEMLLYSRSDNPAMIQTMCSLRLTFDRRHLSFIHWSGLAFTAPTFGPSMEPSGFSRRGAEVE